MKSLFLSIASSAALCASAIAQGVPAPPAPPPPPDQPNMVFFTAAPQIEAFHKSLRPVVNAPYQAQSVSETTQHLADGNVIQHSNTSKVARDSQGRTWTEETIEKIGPWSSDAGPHTVIFLNDPVAGTSYVLHPDTKTAEKLPGKGNVMYMNHIGGPGGPGLAIASSQIVTKRLDETAAINKSSDTSTTTADLGTQQINGVAAQGKRVTNTIPANTIGNQLPIVTTSETWYSPELQTVVQSKHDDPRFGETTFSLTNIQKGEPPADLFQVPSDYTVTSGPPKKPLPLNQ